VGCVKALILYWSVGGTTQRVAERITEGIRSAGAECVTHDLRGGVPGDAISHDIIGVGFPVHYFRPPTVVSECISELGRLDGRSVFAFSLNGTTRGAALNRVRSALARAGGDEIGTFTSYGEDNFYPYARQGWLFSPEHPTERELQTAGEFGAGLVAAHRRRRADGTLPVPRSRDPHTHPVHALERLVTGPFLTRIVYSRLFRVDPERCTSCGRCARRCPVRNITWKRGALPRWGRGCVLCLDCVTTCPEEAVRCPLDWAFFRPFMLWNVRHALADPDLARTRVEHRGGRFTRLDDRETPIGTDQQDVT
jgi:flavodoxin/NAD-dependent dihydropyrimidine dehydrogenase PreA subunit